MTTLNLGELTKIPVGEKLEMLDDPLVRAAICDFECCSGWHGYCGAEPRWLLETWIRPTEREAVEVRLAYCGGCRTRILEACGRLPWRVSFIDRPASGTLFAAC